MGFCFFNNCSLAALAALRQPGIERVLIVDWDVHHGNGIEKVRCAPGRLAASRLQLLCVLGRDLGPLRCTGKTPACCTCRYTGSPPSCPAAFVWMQRGAPRGPAAVPTHNFAGTAAGSRAPGTGSTLGPEQWRTAAPAMGWGSTLTSRSPKRCAARTGKSLLRACEPRRAAADGRSRRVRSRAGHGRRGLCGSL